MAYSKGPAGSKQIDWRQVMTQQTGISDLTNEEVEYLRRKYAWKQYTPIPCVLGIVIIFLSLLINELIPTVPNPFEQWAGWVYGSIFGLIVPGIVLASLGNAKWRAEVAHFKQARQKKVEERAAQEALGAKLAAEEEQRQRKIKEEEDRRQREIKDQQRLETLKSLVEMSEEILVEDLASVLEMSRPDLLRRITEWGKQFGIKLKGDRVVIAQQDVAGFIAQLDEEMKDWARSEDTKGGKRD